MKKVFSSNTVKYLPMGCAEVDPVMLDPDLVKVIFKPYYDHTTIWVMDNYIYLKSLKGDEYVRIGMAFEI